MIVLFFLAVRSGGEKSVKRALGKFAYVLMWLGLTIFATKGVVPAVLNGLEFQRSSPTLVMEKPIRVSKLMKPVKIKDAALDGFPSDHTAFLFVWAGFCCFYGSRRYGIGAIAYACAMSLPRLVVGAHWFTDLGIGSSAVAITILSWAGFLRHAKITRWSGI
jgi:membrane-associated phospholipid phosphatase